MTSLKTAQEKARKKMWGVMYLAECNDLQYETIAKDLDTLVATLYTDLLDSIEKGMGGEIEIPEGACFYSWTPQEVMDAEGYNTAHRKFLSVIKEHRP